jgi:hypothetical protein
MNKEEISKLQKFLQQKFGNASLEVRARPRKDDSCEVYIGEEFMGVIYLDDEDGERDFNFQMAILEIDLEEMD